MKKRIIGRILVLTLLAGFPLMTTGCGEEEEVVDTSESFTSAEGGFSITYPGNSVAPDKQTVPVPTEIGNIDMNMFLVDAGEKAFMTAYADYPDELIGESDPQTMLNMGRDGAITNVSGELLREKDHKVQGFPAKEFYARGKQGEQDVFMRANIIMANARLYQVLYLGFTEDALDSQEADDYMASFRIEGDEKPDEE